MPPEVQEHLAELKTRISDAQIELNKIAAGSTSLFIAGWRPAAGWLGVFGLAYNAIIAPLFGLPMSPDNTLELLLYGLLGLGGLRTVEKMKRVNR